MPERTRACATCLLLGCLPGVPRVARRALLSDDLRWEPGGTATAPPPPPPAGECPPALVLDLLRELRATQRVCAEQRAAVDSLTSQRRLLMDDKRRMRRDEDEAARETALAEAEAEARDLVQELRALVVEARAERTRRRAEDGERRRRRARDVVFFRNRNTHRDGATAQTDGGEIRAATARPAVAAPPSPRDPPSWWTSWRGASLPAC